MRLELKTTRQAAAAAPAELYQVNYLLRTNRITPSHRDPTGRWWWTEDDIARLRAALATDKRRRPKTAAK